MLMAAFAAHGLCEALAGICLQKHEVVLSDFILAELTEHLAGRLRMPPKKVRSVETFLRGQAEIVSPADMSGFAFSDPDDLPVLGTALAGNADVLVTGDKELLKLGKVQNIPIVSPREFYDRLRQDPSAT